MNYQVQILKDYTGMFYHPCNLIYNPTKIFREALEEATKGIKCSDIVVNILRYADDNVLLTTS